MKRVKVLVIDDSALVRDILSKGLAMDPALEVVGTAANPYIARDKIVQLKPDVLTLDVEMPNMDGLEFLRRLMAQYPMPVVMVSALTVKGGKTTLAALENGAVDFVTKPSVDVARGLSSMLDELRLKVRMAAGANMEAWEKNRRLPTGKVMVNRPALSESTDKVIAVGASTGGTEAVRSILKGLPAATPGVVIVQHMPAGFTRHFADALNGICQMEVKEAATGDRVLPGRVLIAPGDTHMRVIRSGGVYQVECSGKEKVGGHCPSVNVLFESVAKCAATNAVGVILTGMGSDGADGLLAMRKAGARTVAQDEATSIVFGMPKAAWELGGAESLVPLQLIGAMVCSMVTRHSRGKDTPR